jgi:ribosomal protein S18 acetylase RimI-like enzyme
MTPSREERSMSTTNLEKQSVIVRQLRPDDLEAVVALDAKNTGRRREEFFKTKLQQNLAETGIQISLAGELAGAFVGFLLARVFYGEFGTMEPVAVLDTFGVHPDFRSRGVGRALLHQLRTNLNGLGIPRLRTDVSWDDQDLLGFFHHEGFRPAAMICLELDLMERPRYEE